MAYGIWADGLWADGLWADSLWIETGLKLKINGVDKTAYLMEDSLVIDSQINSITSASFMLREKVTASTGLVASGNEIIVNMDGTRIFGGPAKVVTEEQPYNASVFFYTVEAYCFGSYLSHHIVSAVYEDQLAGDIIKDIVDDELLSEGFTYTAVEDGPIITKAVFNYVSVQQAFEEISEITGYDFYVDCHKNVHFFTRETNAAPFSLTDAAKNCKTLTITDTHENYRNAQYLRAGQDTTDPQTETFIGDSNKITYTLSYPVALVPSISVNGDSKTVGILGIETGKDFYWNKNDRTITQDSAAAVLNSSHVLSVTYSGLFPIVVIAEDTEEISARAAAENGHGRYESIAEDSNIDNLQLAVEKANGLLRRYGKINKIINFTTDQTGLEAGQLLPINLTAHSLDDSYLIESVSINDESGVGLRYSVTALSGETFGGWADFFKKLASRGRNFVIRENEVLILMRFFADNLSFTDTFSTPTSAAPICDVVNAEVGFSEIC